MDWNSSLIKKREDVALKDLSPIQREITKAIGSTTVHIDELAEKTRLSLSTLNIELFDLLMNGFLNELPGKRFMMA